MSSVDTRPTSTIPVIPLPSLAPFRIGRWLTVAPDTSQEAKQHSKEVLEELGFETGDTATGTSGPEVNIEGKNPGNVAGGYKAYVYSTVIYRPDSG